MSRGASPAAPPPGANHLLGSLPAADFSRLREHLVPVRLALGEALDPLGSHARHVHFPVSGLVSLLDTLEDGNTTELAVIGNDGCTGIAVLLGGQAMPQQAVVQIAGCAYRIGADILVRHFRESRALQRVLLAYIHTLMLQVAQTAVCNRHHTIVQQLCRWLLLSLDRVDSKEVCMTQELISHMLGVRRSGITEAARKLQQAGLIEYRRGRITVPDRAKLQAHACECYAVVKKETDRMRHEVAAHAILPARQQGFLALI